MIKRFTTQNAVTGVITTDTRVLPGLTEFPGPLPAALHYARTSPGDHVWQVNGVPHTVQPTQDPASGLWWSQVTVGIPAGAVSGETVIVRIDADSVEVVVP